uniref:Uncharacterized protein n=1 Tax=viral metagenome TaxID=1070528 RepID=A0A6M3LLB2_9ZZZZ
MDSKKLEEIRQLAEKATPGPTIVENNIPDMEENCLALFFLVDEYTLRKSDLAFPHALMRYKQDADYYAALDPQIMLEMVGEIERLREIERNYYNLLDRQSGGRIND